MAFAAAVVVPRWVHNPHEGIPAMVQLEPITYALLRSRGALGVALQEAAGAALVTQDGYRLYVR